MAGEVQIQTVVQLIKFGRYRQFRVPKTATSFSCKPLYPTRRLTNMNIDNMKASKILIFIFAILAGLYGLTYLDFDLQHHFLKKRPEVRSSLLWQISFYTHVIAGIISVIIGPFQFIEKSRIKNIKRHRNLGKLYVFIILVGSPFALYTGLNSNGGTYARIGFAVAAILWFVTTFKAYRYARQKNFIQHKNWMVLSYSLTFSVVTLRLWLFSLWLGLGINFGIAFACASWLCWVPNLLVGQLINSKLLLDKK
jgi:hypothetical protein